MKDIISDITSYAPSSIQKLLALWENLQVETKITTLNELISIKHGIPYEFTMYLLNSENNEYVKYLAVKNTYISDEDDEHREQLIDICKDSSELIKAALIESDVYSEIEFENPKNFWEMPKSERFAITRSKLSGKEFSRLIEWKYNQDGSHFDLEEIISEFFNAGLIHSHNTLSTLEYKKPFYNRNNGDIHENHLNKLWNLVKILPDHDASFIAERLYTKYLFDFGDRAEIDLNDVLEAIKERPIVIKGLLKNKYFESLKYREKIFYSTNEAYNSCKHYAPNKHFRIDDRKFYDILNNRPDLIEYIPYDDYDLPKIEHLIYYHKAKDNDYGEYFNLYSMFDYTLKRIINEGTYEEKKEAWSYINLYEIASKIVDGKIKKIPRHLISLKMKIVKDDIWLTYLRLKSAFWNDPSILNEFPRLYPRHWRADELIESKSTDDSINLTIDKVNEFIDKYSEHIKDTGNLRQNHDPEYIPIFDDQQIDGDDSQVTDKDNNETDYNTVNDERNDSANGIMTKLYRFITRRSKQ
jgi:hypothetical protein